MHSVVHEMYVNVSPGSFITLKIDTSSPMKPDWYTLQGPCSYGLFMKMVRSWSATPGTAMRTSDSYAIAISVPG